MAKFQRDAVCVLRKFNIFISRKGARLQHDAKCPHVIESNEVRGRGFRQGIGPSTVVGLGLIGAAAGSERTGSDGGDGLGPIGAACGSDRGAVGSDRVRLWVRSLFPDRAASHMHKQRRSGSQCNVEQCARGFQAKSPVTRSQFSANILRAKLCIFAGSCFFRELRRCRVVSLPSIYLLAGCGKRASQHAEISAKDFVTAFSWLSLESERLLSMASVT